MICADPHQIDAARLNAVARGDAAAFRSIWDEHHPRVLRLAAGIVLDRNAARDVAQDVFLALYRAAPAWEARASLSSWLHRVTVNASLSLRRRLATAMRSAAGLLALPPAREKDAERELIRADAVAVLRTAITRLPASTRAVVTLSLECDLTPGEIAEVLRVSPNVARVRLHRALVALREALAREGIGADVLASPEWAGLVSATAAEGKE